MSQSNDNARNEYFETLVNKALTGAGTISADQLKAQLRFALRKVEKDTKEQAKDLALDFLIKLQEEPLR